MDIFFFQLVLIFIPGMIWERTDAKYGTSRPNEQWEILRRTLMFGLAAYMATFAIYWLCSFCFPGTSFQVFKFQKDVEFLDNQSAKLIFHASFVSLICATAWLYVTNYKLLTHLLQGIGATKRDGDEDVWEFSFNSGKPEVEYVHVRDFEKRIVYAGWVESFSETEKLRELRLKDVAVFDFDGKLLFKTPRIYLARKMDNIDIEFPVR